MKRPSNDRIQRHYFEQFRIDYQLPVGELQYTDKPDVIICGPITLGIEITNFYIDDGRNLESEQKQRPRRLRVLQRAQELYLATGGKSIELSVDFNPIHPIRKTEPVARALAVVAGQLASQPSGLVTPCQFKHISPLRFIYLNATEYPDAKWQLVQCYTASALSFDRLQEIVNEKSKKLKEYQPCDEYWLLVVVDFMDRAQDQHLEWSQGQTLPNSAYKKVLLYKPQFRQVLEIPC